MGSDGSFVINNGLFGRPVRPGQVLVWFLFVVKLEYTLFGLNFPHTLERSKSSLKGPKSDPFHLTQILQF